MPTTRNQILFLLSGGQSNREAKLSLGGSPSTTKITDGLNNLFEDLTQAQSQSGYTDYKCFYIKNVSESDWESTYIYIKSQTDGGATATIGVELNNDKQQFNIISTHGATGGYFTVNFGSVSGISVAYESNISDFADNFREALINSGQCSQVNVVGTVYSNISYPPYFLNATFQVFAIEFIGTDGHRNQPLITLDENHLTCAVGDAITINSSKLTKGAPANTTATQIPSATNAPDNIAFLATTRNSPIHIGTIKVGEYVPIWIKRDILANTEQFLNDRFTVGITGTSSIF